MSWQTPLYSDQMRALDFLARGHQDPAELARSYAELFAHPEIEGGVLGMSPDIDWRDEETLARIGRILERLLDEMAHIGGEETPEGVHPEVVALRFNRRDAEYGIDTTRTVGTGVLVGERVLLTAAHVAETHRPNRVFFREFASQLAIEGWVKAEDPAADIAAVVLKDTQQIPPLPIAADGDYDLNDTFRSVGFGALDPRGSTVAIRNYLPAILVRTLDCSEPEAQGAYRCLPGKEIVAGTIGRTACNNDSGGALLVRTGDTWALVGVARRGVDPGCRSPERYARVTAYRAELNAKLRQRGLPEF